MYKLEIYKLNIGKKKMSDEKNKQLGKVATVKALSEQEDALEGMLKNKPEESTDPLEEKKEWWATFYSEVFGLEGSDFSGVIIPQRPETKDLVLLFIPKWVNAKKLIEGAKNKKLDFLIEAAPGINVEKVESQNISRPYAIWVVDSEDPDFKISGPRRIPGDREIMSIEERIIFGALKFRKGHHYIDVQNPTLTSAYTYVGNSKTARAVITKYTKGGLRIDTQDISLIGFAREVFGRAPHKSR